MADQQDIEFKVAHDSRSEDESPLPRPRQLPLDLPRSLDDRKSVPAYTQETEYYDAWQGEKLPDKLDRPYHP
jgi:hypothetical protein